MDINLFEKWEHLVEGVTKEKIPVEFIKKLVVKLHNRRQRTINVKMMMEQGMEPDDIEEAISSKLEELDKEIIGIEFILDIEGIAEIVQPITTDLLKGL